MRRYWLL